MNFPIWLEARELEDGNPDKGYSLVLVTTNAEGTHHVVELQTGYASVGQTVDALLQALTYAPPDMTLYEEGLSKVGEILDGINNLNDAMTQVGERLGNIEEWIQEANQRGGGPPAKPKVNPLLPGKVTAPAAPPAQQAPPPLRRPQATIPHQPAGGAFRPGQGGHPTE